LNIFAADTAVAALIGKTGGELDGVSLHDEFASDGGAP
jgi:hypothetical protein